MLAAILGIFLNLLLFFIIGFWPTFWLSSSKNRLLTALAIAPTTGFAITSIAATFLVLMDFPVKAWSEIYVLVCIAISSIILLYCIIIKRSEFTDFLKEPNLLWLIAGFVIAAIIVILPMLLGGFQFTLFRGNAADSFNYMAMAEYLDREPFSEQNEVLLSETFQTRQLYIHSKRLLTTRWTTSAVLAFSSRAVHVPINQFEYSYSVLFFIVAFGPTFVLANKLGLENLKALIIAIVVCTGYWAQFVLDTRAFSQMNSIPLVLAICYVISRIVSHPLESRFKEPVLCGILGTSLFFSYPEVIPLCGLGLVLFGFALFIKKALPSDFVLHLGIALIVLVLLSIPNYQFIINFMLRQLKYAADTNNNWQEVYYAWLYSAPFFGVWGLSPFVMLKGLFAAKNFGVTVEVVLILLGSILSVIVLVSIVMVLISKRIDQVSMLLVSFVCAILIQLLFLVSRQQWWTVGKGLALGYPFLLLLVGTIGWRKQIFNFHPALIRVFNICIWVWVASQLVLSSARSLNAITQKEYINYLTHNANYRQYDFDLSSLQRALDKSKPSSILIPIQDPAYMEYLNLVFGWDHTVFSFSDVINQLEGPIEQPRGQHVPEFIIFDKKQCEISTKKVIANNSEIVLMKYDHTKFICFYVSNPNGIDIVNNQKFYWLENKKTFIDIQSSDSGIISVVGDFTMGPSLPEMTGRNLMVTTIINGISHSSVFIIKPGPNKIKIPIDTGDNTIELSVLDKPIVDSLPNGDPRILLLGLQNLQIQFEKESE